ncbi:MAG: hypothetical protein R6U89_12000 [Dehalococcoidia bacterium]
MAWNDTEFVYRSLSNKSLRLQKVDALGHSEWGEDGILICSSSKYVEMGEEEKREFTRSLPTYTGEYMIAYGDPDGIIVGWNEVDSEEKRITHVEKIEREDYAAWHQQWLSQYSGQYVSKLVSDGSGGVIVFMGGSSDSYIAQKINSEGRLEWPSGGVSLGHNITQVIGDGLGGAFLLRSDWHLPSPGPPSRLYIQKIGAQGELLWPDQTLVVSTEEEMFQSDIISDEAGGAIVAWIPSDRRTKSMGEIRAQRFDSSGQTLWKESGVDVFGVPELMFGAPVMVRDGMGGTIITAAAGNSSKANGVYAQRLNDDGDYLWGGGVRVTKSEINYHDMQ